MSEGFELDDVASDIVERYVQFRQGRGPEPDLGHLELSERRAMQARLEIVDALVDRIPPLPALEDDPVATRLGLLGDRQMGGLHNSGEDVANGERLDSQGEQETRPIHRVLGELELIFHGQVIIEWSPPWIDWNVEGFEPLAQCSVLGDAMALIVTERVIGTDEPVQIASFLRKYPDVSAVGLVSGDASRAKIVDAAACSRAIDPVRGWLEPGSFIVTESFELALTRYFQQRLPRWDRVTGLTELIELGDVESDVRQIVVGEIATALRTRPRLEHKRRAQDSLRIVDSLALSTMIVKVQTGEVSDIDLVARVCGLAELTP